MPPPNLIPTLDPNPLPAPYWVFKLLLLVDVLPPHCGHEFRAGRRRPGAGFEVAVQE